MEKPKKHPCFPELASLLDVLFSRGGLEILAGLVIGSDDAEGLLKKFAGLEAFAACIAFGLHRGLTFWRNSNFDNAVHQDLLRMEWLLPRQAPPAVFVGAA